MMIINRGHIDLRAVAAGKNKFGYSRYTKKAEFLDFLKIAAGIFKISKFALLLYIHYMNKNQTALHVSY